MKSYVDSKNLIQKTEQWLDEVSRLNRDSLIPVSDKTALLIIDMQNYFLLPGAPAYLEAGEAIIANVKKLLDLFRQLKRPVIFTRHVHKPDGSDAGIMAWWWGGMCLEDSDESRIHELLKPLSDEKVIAKHRYSAFYNTDLETVLRCMKIEDLIVSGVMTNLCCESTARDAYFRDYRVFFPVDATATTIEEMHRASLINLAYGFASITSVGRLTEQLEEQG